LFGSLKFFQANTHPCVSLFRLISVRTTQAIPPGEIKPKVAVCPPGDDRMVDSVHIWSYYDKTQPSIH